MRTLYGFSAKSAPNESGEETEAKSAPIVSSPTKGGRIGFVGLALKGPVVMGILPDSPASRAGLAAGDKVVSIDKQPTNKMSDDEIAKKIKGLVGTSVALVIERQGKTYSCPLIRTDLHPELSTLFYPRRSRTQSIQEPQMITSPIRTITPSEIDERLVSKNGKSVAGQAAYHEVIEGLNNVPGPLKKVLADWGLKILIVPTIVESDPELASKTPEGYLDGGGYDNCGGLYKPNEKTVYVAEKVSFHNSPSQRNSWVKSTTLHEVGHSFDHYGHYSKSDQFLSVYDQDFHRLGSEERNRFQYFLQAGDRGPEELFAELFMAAQGVGPEYRESSSHLKEAFPKSLAYVKAQIDLAK